MNIKEIKNTLLNESYFEIDHPSGLKIFVMPKPGYSSSFAVFGTNYGSVDTCFRVKGEKDFVCVPEGIAHFLEHKLFESEELDAFELFSKTGASANAYTSFDKTCYIFSCSANFDKSLEILLNFVKQPYFTQKTVEKEQGIIGQEIRMYQDNPDWQVLFNLLRAMYESNPVRIDIAGTVESIAEISAELLYGCYNTFYNFSNMALAVAGDVTVEGTLEIANRLLKTEAPVLTERKAPDEPRLPVEAYTEQKMDVGIKKFSLGFKETLTESVPDSSRRAAINILLETICGKVSRLYESLLNRGLINQSFSKEYFYGRGFSVPLFSGESSRPQEVRDAIIEEIEALRASGISEEDFETARRRLYGAEIMGFNDVDELANNIIGSYFDGGNLFGMVEAYRKISLDEVQATLSTSLERDCACLSVIS